MVNGAHPPAKSGNDRRRLAQALALTTWDLARTGRNREPGPRGRVIHLRSQQRLQGIVEAELGVPSEHRSLIRIKDGSRPACLLIHSAAGTPAEFRGFADELHRSGMTIYAPLLPGHGRGEDAPEIMWRACLNDVHNRLLQLRRASRQVYVIGYGFGAALALHLAKRESVSGLALLSPALIPRVPLWQRLLLRLGMRRISWLRRRMGYGLEILEAMETARGVVSRLECPIYAAQADDDDRISPASLRFVQKRAKHPASRFRVFAEGGYDFLQTHGKECLYKEIANFFNRRR